MLSHRPHALRATSGLALVFVLGACSGLSNTERGAVGGATTGAVLGGVIADATDSNTAVGAILGAAIGGAAGAAIGSRMDNQAEELEDELPGAEVERVGEGIKVTFDSGILFDFDSAALRSEARANLADLAASLSEYAGTRVLVVGHTDSSGSDSYNQGLSERRAASARAYLLQQGLSGDRVEAVGRGETEPVADNATESGAQANRRVEVAIFASEDLQDEMRARYGGGR
ncbi:OmpA family protein [Gaopeijia maritima]|uniref:OmpA family protein n=1 Tax=Gaopeijia maritima TaxID=3119007 RepID=A0ABU9ECW1_9BACT